MAFIPMCSKAALCMAGDNEWDTGLPKMQYSLVDASTFMGQNPSGFPVDIFSAEICLFYHDKETLTVNPETVVIFRYHYCIIGLPRPIAFMSVFTEQKAHPAAGTYEQLRTCMLFQHINF